MVNTAQINVGYTDVVSPITGRSGISVVTEGAFVQASAATLMTTVQQIDPIYVDVTQSSVEGLQLRRDVASGKLKLNGPNQARVKLVLEDGREYGETGTLVTTDITVEADRPIQIVLENADEMPHNLILCEPGKVEEVAKAVEALGAEGFTRGFVPDHKSVLHHTRMLYKGETDRVSFLASVIRELGLEHARVVGRRVEDAVDELEGGFDAVVMRCAGDPGDLLPVASRHGSFLAPGRSGRAGRGRAADGQSSCQVVEDPADAPLVQAGPGGDLRQE